MSLYAELSNKKILVTGASGFIGSHLCHRLSELGTEVHAISRQKHPIEKNGPRWWQGDLTEIETVHHLFATIKPDLIFHLASYVTGIQDLDYVLPTFRNNLMSQVHLLIVASEMGCDRVIFAGSSTEPKPGDSQVSTFSPYVAAKWSASVYTQMFHLLYQLPIVNLRIHMTYGPAQKDLKKLVPYVILSLLRGEAPKLSNGLLQADWIYVEDIVEGLLMASQASKIEGSTIDLGTGTLTSVQTIVEHLVKLVDPRVEPLFGTLPDRVLETMPVADTEATFAKIGWHAKTPLIEGLNHTIAWYRQQSHLRGN